MSYPSKVPHEKENLNVGLLTIVVPLIRPYEGFTSHGGTLHGGMLTSHDNSYEQFHHPGNKKLIQIGQNQM